MTYDVTYQLGGEERIDRVAAPDAATAAATVRDAYARTSDRFELLLVHLVEGDDRGSDSPPVLDGEAVPAGA